MRRVDIKLGYSCNSACIHCVVDDYRDRLRARRRPQDLTTDEYRRELADSRSRGCAHAVFTGGEPTIRKDLCELLACARELGYGITIQTNGRRLASDALVRSLVEAAGPGLAFVIALHAPAAEVHDEITARRGSFEQTVRGIRNVVCAGVECCGKLVLQRRNFRLVPEICRLFHALGAGSVSITFPHALGSAGRHFDDVVPTYAECRDHVLAGIDVCRSHRLPVDTEAMPLCMLPGREWAANELHQAREPYVELKQHGLDEKVLNWSVERPRIKAKGPGCRICRFDPVCEGPWREYPEARGFRELVPVPGRRVLSVEEILDGSYRRPEPRRPTAPAAALPFCT